VISASAASTPPRPGGYPTCSRNLHAAAFGPDREAALRGLVLAEDAATFAIRYLSGPANAYVATERARQAAEAIDHPVMLGMVSFTRSNVAISCGLWKTALTVAEQAADALRPYLSLPEAPEVYGQLLLTQAFCRYAMGKADESTSLIADAQSVANRTGETTTLGLMFGPTNINFWRIAMEADGDSPGRAVEIARATNPQAVAQISRRTAYYLDTARALARITGTRRRCGCCSLRNA
jgi:hypothetical protein